MKSCIRNATSSVGLTPVFAAESEQSEIFHAALDTSLDSGAYCFHPAFMPGHPRHEAFFRPAAIAVHDDGDMPGNRAGFRYFAG